jgi:hypothetical protein
MMHRFAFDVRCKLLVIACCEVQERLTLVVQHENVDRRPVEVHADHVLVRVLQDQTRGLRRLLPYLYLVLD